MIKRLSIERKNRLNEERLLKTFEAINDGYWDWDIPSGNLIVNDRWFTMLGYEPNEFPATYENFLKLLHPDDLENAKLHIDETKKNHHTSYDNEFRLRTKSGDYRFISARGRIITTTGNYDPVRMVGIHTDISDRKRFEQDKLLFYETQRKLLLVDNLKELYDLVGNCLLKLLSNGHVIFTQFDDPEMPIKIAGAYGFDPNARVAFEDFLHFSKKFTFRMKDNDPTDYKLWDSNSLIRYKGGIFGLTKNRAPREVCESIEKKLGITDIHLMGCKWNDRRFGGFILFSKDGLGPNSELIETLLNETAIAIQRIITEEESQVTQSRYRNIFKASPVGIATIDKEANILTANPEFCTICGYKPEELIGMKISGFIHSESGMKDQEKIPKIISGEIDVYSTTEQIVCKDGELVWVQVAITKVCDPQGKLLYLLVMVSNINKEMLAEKATTEKQRFLEMVLNTIPNMVFVRDSDGRYRLGNVAFADAMGSSVQEIVGKTDLQLGNTEQLTAVAHQQDLEILAGGSEFFRSDVDMFFPVHGIKSMQLVKRALPEGEYKQPAVLGVLTDISERKKYEQALLDKEKRYRLLFESMPQGALYLMADGTIQDINPAALDILGLSRDEAGKWINNSIEWKLYGEDGKILTYEQSPIREVFQTGEPVYNKIYRFFNLIRKCDVWISVNVLPQYLHPEKMPDQVYITIQDITALKQIENELRVSELKYRTLIQHSPAGVYQTDQYGRYVFFNDQLCEFIGMSSEEMIHNGWSECIHSEDRTRVVQLWNEYVKQGGKWSAEYRIQNKKTKEVIWVVDEANELQDEEGKRIGYIGSKFNLTTLKNAENRLRRSEEKYRLLTENMKDVVWTLDTETMQFVYMSPSVVALRGFTPEEVVSSPLSAALTKEGADKFIELIQQKKALVLSAKTNTSPYFTYEIPQPRKDGSVVWTEVTTGLHLNPETNHWDLHGVTRDITDRKKAEEALQQSEEKHRLLIENSHDIIYTLSRNGELTFVSRAWTLFLGQSTNELIGASFLARLHSEDRKVFQQFFQKVVDSKTRQTGVEYRIRHADGLWRWHTSSGVPILDKNGKCVGIEGIARDITEQKMAEAALQESEERYRVLVENSPVGIMLVKKGKFIYANTTGLKLFGVDSLGDLSGKAVMQFIHPDSKKELIKRIVDIGRGKPNSLMEIKIIKQNGDVCLTESTSSEVKINGETISLIFGQDITTRKTAEEKIRKNSEDLLLIKQLNDSVNRGDSLLQSLLILSEETKKIFPGNGAAIYLLEPGKDYLELQSYQLNQEFLSWMEEKLGIKIPKVKIKLTPQSFYQKILNEKKLQYVEGSKAIMSIMSEFTENRALKKMIPLIYKQLSIRSVLSIPLIVKNDSVGVLEFSSNTPLTQEDLRRFELISSELGSIIRRKQAEEALIRSEGNFRQIVESSNDIFIRQLYPSLEFEYVSPKVIDLLGYTQAESLQIQISEIDHLIHPEDQPKFKNFGWQILQTWQANKGNLVVEFRLRSKQGNYKWFNGNYSLVVDDEKKDQLVICTLSDITERKLNELSLKFRIKLMQQTPSLSLDELVTAILDEIQEISGSEVGCCHFVDEDQKLITRKFCSTSTLKRNALSSFNTHQMTVAEDGVWLDCLEHRTPLIQNDASSLSNQHQRMGIQREIIVPIIRNDKVVSIFGLGNKKDDYTHNDLDLVSKLSDMAWDIVETKNIETALHESEAIFNAFMENSPIYVFFKDKNGRSKQLSRNYEQMLGKPMDQLLNKNMDELFPSDLSKTMVEDDRRILSEGKTVVIEEEMDGRYYSTIKFPIFKEGTPEFLAGFTIDITDRVVSEKKLAESEELYRLISSVVSDYLFSTRVGENNKLELNWVAGAFETMTGYGMAEYKQVGGWRALVYPDDLGIDDRDMRELHQHKKIITEIRTIKKDGSIVWVRVYSQPIWDEVENKLVGINGAVQDITERKKAEEEVKKAAREFEALYDTAKDFSLHRDPFIVLKTICERACLLFGVPNAFVFLYDQENKDLVLKFSKTDVLPQGLHVKLGEGLSGTVAQSLAPLIINDYSKFPGHIPIINQSNVAAAMSVPMLHGGQLLGVLGVHELHPSSHKFTEDDVHFLSLFASQAAGAVYGAELYEKQLQNAAELENRVNERTRELQLKNKELETFTYTVSHDLKAPLRGISGYSSLLMEDHSDQLDDEGKRYLANLVSSTERMNLLIEDLLAYSRIERREIKKSNVNFSELIDKLIVEYQSEIDSGNMQFKKEIEYDTLITDIEAITQATRNLIDNAVKFTSGRKDPEVTIACKKQGDHVLIFVKDNGIGFDMKYYDKIFEIFQRLHLSEEYPGTGVGLAVVRKAVERLGGKIWAESEPEVGSIFYMELPL